MALLELPDLTVDKALELMREAVAERGADFVYAPRTVPAGGAPMGRCRYVYDGKPDCLIGVILHKLGVTPTKLASLDGKGNIFSCVTHGHVVMPYAVAQVLRAAQQVQDSGETWGAALAAAEKNAGVATT